MIADRTRQARWTAILTSVLLIGSASGCVEANPSETLEGSPAGERLAANLATEMPERFGFGRAATHEEIEAWDIDVMTDGTGLPDGEGTVDTGATVYARHCASCHGGDGEGASAAALVGTVPGGGPPFGPRYED